MEAKGSMEALSAKVRAELLDESDESPEEGEERVSYATSDLPVTPQTPLIQNGGDPSISDMTYSELVYETQRLNPAAEMYTLNTLRDSDWPHWADEHGNVKNKNGITPPEGFEWAGPWKIDHNPEYYDPDGWEYSSNWTKGWCNDNIIGSEVRRRKWIRHTTMPTIGVKEDTVPNNRLSETQSLQSKVKHESLTKLAEDKKKWDDIKSVVSNMELPTDAYDLHRSQSDSLLNTSFHSRATNLPAITPIPSYENESTRYDQELPDQQGGDLRVVETDSGLVAEVTEITYENQRSGLVGGFSTNWLLPYVDKRGQWSAKDGKPSLPKDSVVLPHGWTWTSDWAYPRGNDMFDNEGWQYAFSFWDPNWKNKVGAQTFVRRRMWLRSRQMILEPKANDAGLGSNQEDNLLLVDIWVVVWVAAVIGLLFLSLCLWWVTWSRVGTLLVRLTPLQIPDAISIDLQRYFNDPNWISHSYAFL